jgi:hypothetical protein
MVGHFAIRFFGTPGDEVLGLGDGLGLGFIVTHGNSPWVYDMNFD